MAGCCVATPRRVKQWMQCALGKEAHYRKTQKECVGLQTSNQDQSSGQSPLALAV
jgi:hypothetical protein